MDAVDRVDEVRTVTTCPECGGEFASYAALLAHCEEHPLCADTVRRLEQLARMGLRECPRCGVAILGECQIVREMSGAVVWIHARCLTDAERGEIEREGEEQLREILSANTDPRVTGTANVPASAKGYGAAGSESTRMEEQAKACTTNEVAR